MKKPLLCLDFDGVIHSYTSGWRGASVIPDDPVEGSGAFLLRAVQSFKVAIFSSRSHQWGGKSAMRRYVREILWDACLSDTGEMERAWEATQGTPADYIPWTAYDVRDVADHIHRKIAYPFFKPAALMTIDDRALTFNGNWSDPQYSTEGIRAFKPWNKRPRGRPSVDELEAILAKPGGDVKIGQAVDGSLVAVDCPPITLPYGANEGDLGSVPL